MKFHVLGSGSSGNCSYLETEHARILIDCGFSYRETCKRLAQIGRSPDTIDAIFITHEHSDHIDGLEAFTNHHRVAVFASQFTQNAIRMIAGNKMNFKVCNEVGCLQKEFVLFNLLIKPFPVPHLACQPVNFVFTVDYKRAFSGVAHLTKLAVLTDLGHIPLDIIPILKGTNILSIESNYDPVMLALSDKPDAVKARTAGGQGHLSNQQAASILDHIQPERIILTHLSMTANAPIRALHAFRNSKAHEAGFLYVSHQDAASNVL